jgi:hypothetical protein
MKTEILKQEIAFNKKTGRVYCEDGAKYSPHEILLFYEAGASIDVGVHVVKHVFSGEVIKVERNLCGNGQTKQIESGTGNGLPDNTNPGEKIPGANGVGAKNEGGELDIY